MERFLRPGRKWTDIFPIAAVLSVIVLIIGYNISALLMYGGLSSLVVRMCGDEDVAAFMLQYLSDIGIWIAIIIYMALFRANRPMFRAFLYNGKGNTGKGLLWGLVLGFGTNALCVLLSWIMGDIKLSYNGIDPLILLMFFISVLIQSGAEELADRLYLYQKLRRRYKSPLVAILLNSLVFMLLHVFNPGFTAVAGSQIFIIGVIFSLLVYYYDSLWCAIMFHMAWNYTQNIIFGLPNSGIVSAYSIFRLEAASARNGLFYNVNFGVEGSVGSSLILLALAITIYVKNKDRGEMTDLWGQGPS